MERTIVKITLIPLLCLLIGVVESNDEVSNFGLIVHGGAGSFSNLDENTLNSYKTGIDQALTAGYEVLENGGSSVDAVTAAVIILEDLPLFNAGKGSVYTEMETQEMDSSIMDGKSGKGGAVAGISKVKNPIVLARKVMDETEHVMLIGEGAEKFAKEVGVELVDPSYFYSEKNLKRVRKSKKDKKLGTVGAAALDKYGNLAAATSTGGRTNKMTGRVGDSPILGAGTWAQNDLCAVSGTGHGEYFMRLLTAADVCKLMEYSNLSLEDSSNSVVNKLTNLGAQGGIISIDSSGTISAVFNTKAMARGYKTNEISKTIKIYKDK
ncbi:MAG: beta-aspartyl-peptidase [Gammaproteobacteria bacterium]|nr:beta-aspartyl-peptidase [Gammaproteobacteria bacterium]|tara:strand:+ start:4518 stop:5486 length:969 start_codon:yes stop_codon:yes gene_type:complete